MFAPDHQQFTKEDFLQQVDKNRTMAGIILLAMLGLGLAGYFPLIIDEWPRLEHWQRVAIWIGDVTAIVLVVPWMFYWDASRVDFGEKRDLEALKRRMRWTASTLLLSLVVDIAITVYGIHGEKLASARSVPVEATVVHVESIRWQPVTHYKLALEFKDAAGRPQRGQIVFTKKPEGSPPWIDFQTTRAIANGTSRFPINIRYDPVRPARVWAKAEPWNRGHALAYLFAFVHIFQLIVIGTMAIGAFVGKTQPSQTTVDHMPLIAVTVEACAIALIGFLYFLRGF